MKDWYDKPSPHYWYYKTITNRGKNRGNNGNDKELHFILLVYAFMRMTFSGKGLASYFDMRIGKFITAISTMFHVNFICMDKRNGYFDSLVLAGRIVAMIDFLDIDIIYLFPDFWLWHRHGILLKR
jgi:hypothetical protein